MSSPVDDALSDLSRALEALGVGWFLFGAQAAIIYGSTRVTEDIDVTVDLGERTARELVSALQRRGFKLRVGDTAGFVERTRVPPVVLPEGTEVDLIPADDIDELDPGGRARLGASARGGGARGARLRRAVATSRSASSCGWGLELAEPQLALRPRRLAASECD
jgi:hypothetical protein